MSTTTSNDLSGDPIRLPKRKLPPLLDHVIPALALITGCMLFVSVPNIIAGDGWWSIVKGMLLAASATVVAFGINKLAIERGAPLATTGYWGAGLISIGSILAVGGGLFAATFSGLVLKDVAALQLQEHGTRLAHYVAARGAASAEAGSAGPAMQVIANDLAQKRDCEVAVSCVSGRGSGGLGPVARALGELAGRAAAISTMMTEATKARDDAVEHLNVLVADYQTALSDETRSIWDRRSELQVTDVKIRWMGSALDEAMPLDLLKSYAAELSEGASVPGQPEVTARLGAILGKHGQSLAAVLASIKSGNELPPTFPARTGVSDTFDYFGHFLPVAAITAVVELLFPLVLWAYTFWALSWEKYKIAPPGERIAQTPPDQNEVAAPTKPRRSDTPASADNVTRFPRRRRRGGSATRGGQGTAS